jgi:four helix bundle protein
VGIRSYKDLKIWQQGMALAKGCYWLTRRFPSDEMFGMTSQIRRAAGSIPCNIAEGHGRETTREFIRFLRIAQGSLKELETQIALAADVGLCSAEEAQPLLMQSDEIGRMIRSLLRKLQSKGS